MYVHIYNMLNQIKTCLTYFIKTFFINLNFPQKLMKTKGDNDEWIAESLYNL
jgi:hypothetical protein